VRNEIGARFTGEGAVAELYGLSLVRGSDLVDNHTFIDHALPHCESHELYKAILDDQARGVFSGKVLVRQDAQKTDAKQTNKTLVLSKRAQMNTKPQLEIYADDVKCTHGATIGQQDEEALFYLRTRGIGLVQARGIMNHAFAGDVAGKIPIEPLKQKIDARIFDWESK
jgi:Fe-S cluster assembly protein SufD